MNLTLKKSLNKKSLLEPTELLESINALPGIFDVSSIPLYTPNGDFTKGWDSFLIFFEVDPKDNTGLFFLTRCLDRRYFKHGDNWNIKLEVGDSFRDNNLPIIYIIERKDFKIIDIELEIKDLIDNMNHHLNHTSFMKNYKLDINKFYVVDENNGKPWSLVAI